MGVYVFRCMQYFKIGHYAKTNPWSRVAHRLFSSCKCPREIEEKISMDTLELVAWFPTLNKRHEKKTHKLLKKFRVCGEWFTNEGMRSALCMLHLLGPMQRVLTQHKEQAMKTRRRL